MLTSTGGPVVPEEDRHSPNRQVVEEFRARGGTVSGLFAGMPLLVLGTVGARSGEHRVAPLTYLADGPRRYVTGT